MRSRPGGLEDAEAARDGAFPELVNRIDLIVNFQTLDAASIRAVCAKELNELARREVLAKRNLALTWTDSVVEHLVKHAFDRRYGARPLQRAVDVHITVPLSRLLVAHPDLRNATISAAVDVGGALSFQIETVK